MSRSIRMIGNDSSAPPKSNYSVYRGMSPTTSNRLEQRTKELEDVIEQSREVHLRTEKELNDANFLINDLSDRLDEADGQVATQAELTRKREQEFAKAKKDLELLTVQYESSEASLKKRHHEIVTDLEEQLNKANKLKSKADKDKQTLTIEIDGLNTQLDSANKAKFAAESKLEISEDQLRKLKAQVDEFTRSNQELNGIRSRLAIENAELHRQLQELDGNFGNVSRTKIQLQQALDEAKNKLDEESKIRNTLEIQFNSLQADYDSVHSKLEEETEAADSLRNQLNKLQGDYQTLKARYDRDITAKIEEQEEIRRKLMARIAELESLEEKARNKASKLEKDKNKLTIEIRDISIQLDETTAALNDHAKRLKTSELHGAELQKRNDELNRDLQLSNGENGRLQAELTRLKTTVSDQQAKIDLLTRDHAKLTDALREAESQNKDLSRSVQELVSIRVQLTAERDSAVTELNDSRDLIRDLQARLDSANGSLNQLRSDFEHRLREKDSELENLRKLSSHTIEELQRNIVEIETKSKSDLARLKNKYETESHELHIQIENLNRANAEFGRSNKQLSTKLKETEAFLEAERRLSADARETCTTLERRLISIQTELDDARSLLDTAEKFRKNAENELGDASTRISELNISIQSLTNDKRRMETDFQGMHRDMDAAITARRASDDRADKLQAELNRVSTLLQQLTDAHASGEAQRRQQEIQIKELTVRLEEAAMTKDGKKTISKLQARIHDLEVELDAEGRRGRDAVAENKKLLKLLADLRAQANEDQRLVSEYSDTINVLQSRIAKFKTQLAESEEVHSITMNKYRHSQQLLSEAERRADRIEKNVTLVRHTNITIGAGGRGQRGMSLNRDTRTVKY